MKLGDLGYLRLASQKMHHVAAAQTAVAENIANADTPGYQAKKVESFDSFLDRSRGEMRKTSSGNRPAEVRTETQDDSWEKNPNGNTVSLTQEAMASARLSGQHTLAATLFKQGYSMITLAASKP